MFESRVPGRRSTGAPKKPESGDRRPGTGRLAQLPAGLRWTLLLIVGVAVTAGAGYLVAALVFFPAPLLPNERQVARVNGKTEAQARRDLEKQGLTAEVTGHEPSPTVSSGLVLWQDPPSGVAVPRGTSVSLTLSSGIPRVVVPDVRGYDIDFAQQLLAAAGLRVDGVDSLDIKGVPSGAAGSTSPGVGDSVRIGRNVLLHIAR